MYSDAARHREVKTYIMLQLSCWLRDDHVYLRQNIDAQEGIVQHIARLSYDGIEAESVCHVAACCVFVVGLVVMYPNGDIQTFAGTHRYLLGLLFTRWSHYDPLCIFTAQRFTRALPPPIALQSPAPSILPRGRLLPWGTHRFRRGHNTEGRPHWQCQLCGCITRRLAASPARCTSSTVPPPSPSRSASDAPRPLARRPRMDPQPALRDAAREALIGIHNSTANALGLHEVFVAEGRTLKAKGPCVCLACVKRARHLACRNCSSARCIGYLKNYLASPCRTPAAIGTADAMASDSDFKAWRRLTLLLATRYPTYAPLQQARDACSMPPSSALH